MVTSGQKNIGVPLNKESTKSYGMGSHGNILEDLRVNTETKNEEDSGPLPLTFVLI